MGVKYKTGHKYFNVFFVPWFIYRWYKWLFPTYVAFWNCLEYWLLSHFYLYMILKGKNEKETDFSKHIFRYLSSSRIWTVKHRCFEKILLIVQDSRIYEQNVFISLGEFPLKKFKILSS